ncbi:hypothetical protein BK664_24300 [Pseudomonas brassicacearum]|uniref:Uncharacterized protein n=1 Tax=Pseudomonas brassicacearum TaxID=930166 RepID=A0A423J7I4_9PSED|nr:hypothetical protein BK664_24300 [Pseudomonas brassicacearum]
MLGRGEVTDYPLGADLYPFCAKRFFAGAKLARDGIVSDDINGECTGIIASKLAPTVTSAGLKIYVQSLPPVGASLLAMASCQATTIVNVPASSRASSLPQ